MRRGILYVAIFIVLLVAPTAVRYLSFYQLGGTDRQEPPEYAPPENDQVSIPESSDFVDDPEVGEGFVLLDQAHGNFFTLEEIGYLDGRLAARGHELRAYESGELASALRSVKAFIVIAPQEPFTSKEIMAVRDFVARGGRLLLIGDPTRFSVFVEENLLTFTVDIVSDKIPLNSLANEFDIIFNEDYLYNTSESEGNFRNIILRDSGLGENEFTDSLNQIVFYGSHSLQVGPGGESVLMGDENTSSSDTDRSGGLTLAASSEDGRVLALGDIHFLTAPYYTVRDNNAFIARIANFLTETERTYTLADFPYFYDNDINLIYIGSPDLGPDAFDEVIALQDAFRETGRDLSLKAEADADVDTLYLGLYNQANDVIELLASHGISVTIEPPILAKEEMMPAMAENVPETSREVNSEESAPGEDSSGTDGNGSGEEAADQIRLIRSELGNVQMSGTAVVLHYENGNQDNVVVLAASKDGLEATIGRLLDLIPTDATYTLADCLLQPNLALCPTGITNEAVEAELETGGAPDMPAAEEPPTEPDSTDSGSTDTNAPEGIEQGLVGLDETVEGTLESSEAHLWTFRDGPATIDITVEGSDDLDTVLELFGPDNELIESVDSTFSGGVEELLNVELAEGNYTIRISDFFEDGGTYTLTVAPAAEAGGSGDEGNTAGIFIFGDDDGMPLTSGFTSVETLADMLSENYDTTVWLTSENGPLQEDTLTGYSLVIWDSGDYRNEDGALDEDTVIIFNYLEAGGKIVIVGTSPTLFGALDLAPLSDIEVVGDDPVLLDGLSEGDVIELDQTYDAVLLDPLDADLNENDTIFLVRGPGSDESGGLMGIASIEENFGGTQAAILLFPFTALPTDIQETLLTNLMNWISP